MLKAMIPIALLAGVTVAATSQGVHHNRGAAQIDVKDQARLDKRLAGLVPGKPQSCITPSRSEGGSRFGDVQLIKDRFGTLYMTRFEGGCSATDADALISRRPDQQLCRGEIAEARDLPSGMSRGSCIYGDFVPYRRP